MATKTSARSLIMLHAIVLIFGFTGILGKEIQQDSAFIVLLRTAIGAGGIAFFMFVLRPGRAKGFKWHWPTALVGLIIAAHWITFFESIKVSKVSVALAVIAAGAMFVALLNPLIRRKPFTWTELVLGGLAVVGIVLIFGFETGYMLGIILGLISAALAATFTVLNAQLVEQGKPLHISLQELSLGCVGVLVYLLVRDGADFWPETITAWDWTNLLVLGVVATSFAFVVSVGVMREISPFTVALTINLEPVYTIILALAIYGEEEHMSGGFYVGTAVLLGTVFLQTTLNRRKKSAAEAVAQAQ